LVDILLLHRAIDMNKGGIFMSIRVRHALGIAFLFAVQTMLLAIAEAASRPLPQHTILWPEAKNRLAAPARTKPVAAHKGLSGIASYYADHFQKRKTASGHPYYKNAWTAAHRTIPLGTWVRVTNDNNGHSVVVQITDRGPYVKNRVLDLSRSAALALGMSHTGTAPVHLQVVRDHQSTRRVRFGA
jgi:rare lipoprotein A